MGALEASRDTETRQEVSRAVPVPGPMEEQGARAAMAELGAMASPPPRPRPQPPPLRLVPYYPQKNFLGGSRGCIGHSRGALEVRTLGGALEARI